MIHIYTSSVDASSNMFKSLCCVVVHDVICWLTNAHAEQIKPCPYCGECGTRDCFLRLQTNRLSGKLNDVLLLSIHMHVRSIYRDGYIILYIYSEVGQHELPAFI